MLELTRALLARAEGDPRRPVPVVFNLSAWILPYTTLDDWLVGELSARYQIPKKIGQAWLAESRLLPLLDGLDELDVQRRAACVEAINRFTQDAGWWGRWSAVVCRSTSTLPTRLSLNAAVRLLPLGDEQVQGYLAAAGERLAGLRAPLAAGFGHADRGARTPDAQPDEPRLSGSTGRSTPARGGRQRSGPP